MHVHILGLAGTFMSALALLARELGFKVTGSDAHCYPPVSDLLREQGITWTEGYDDDTQALSADLVVVGNAMKRGMPVIESILNAGKAYTSGPQWLAEHVLPNRSVIAVAGTHGKTTATSMIAFILKEAGLDPGFLIGGVATNLNTSASLGHGPWFVIEADEYDSAFFDKRPKFMHYRPQVAILNNLEFDHADIYPNLAAIQQQFHYLLRTVPAQGVVIKPRDDGALNAVVQQGQWSRLEEIALQGNAAWGAQLLDDVGHGFEVLQEGEVVAEVNWSLIGTFNVENALSAIAACAYAGVHPERSAQILARFLPVKRRLEVKFDHNGIVLYDDFAHHPTAIAKTIQALKRSGRHQRILVVLEFASYTMRTGVHREQMKDALDGADWAFILNPVDFRLNEADFQWSFPHKVMPTTSALVDAVVAEVKEGDGVLVMSNRGFENIHQQIMDKI